jgi:hypothetical protein
MPPQPQKVCDPPLDKWIAPYVEALADAGFETFESCDGSEGHSYPEPAIRLDGDRSEGLRALAFALQRHYPVKALRRSWPVIDREPAAPSWELVFRA